MTPTARGILALSVLGLGVVLVALGWAAAPGTIPVIVLTVIVGIALVLVIATVLLARSALRRATPGAVQLLDAIRRRRPGAAVWLTARSVRSSPGDFSLSGIAEYAEQVAPVFAVAAGADGLELWEPSSTTQPTTVIPWTRLDDLDADETSLTVAGADDREISAIVARYTGAEGSQALELPVLADDGRGLAEEERIIEIARLANAAREAALPSFGDELDA